MAANSGIIQQICALCTDKPLSSKQLQRTTKLSKVQVNAALCRGYAAGVLIRTGDHHNYYYLSAVAEVEYDEKKPSSDGIVESALETRFPIELAWAKGKR